MDRYMCHGAGAYKIGIQWQGQITDFEQRQKQLEKMEVPFRLGKQVLWACNITHLPQEVATFVDGPTPGGGPYLK